MSQTQSLILSVFVSILSEVKIIINFLGIKVYVVLPVHVIIATVMELPVQDEIVLTFICLFNDCIV